MTIHKNLTGKKYNRLTLLKHTRSNPIYYLCQCECGRKVEKLLARIKCGKTKSCGCLNDERRKTTNLVHGQSHSPTYVSWRNMMARCNNPNNKQYKDYGGRGITVCDSWHSFKNFMYDMGKKPDKLRIERIDNNKGYFKDNCYWASSKKQARNKRNNHMITYKGKTQCLSDWAIELGIPRGRLNARINKLKWPVEKALVP